MTLNDKMGKPTVTEHIYVEEDAQEIRFRPVKNGREDLDERVFCLRTDPLRLEMFSRHVKDKLRAHWTVPRAVAQEIFTECTTIGQLMHNDPATFEAKYGRNSEEKSQY